MTRDVAELMLRPGPCLRPADAAVAMILVDGRYLLQHRDAIAEIFYPGHWGFFGGALDAGETEEECVVRELFEELELEVAASDLRLFGRFSFDLDAARIAPFTRAFFTVDISSERLASLTCREGAGMATFAAREALADQIPIVPYDSFALWLHAARGRLLP